MLLIQYWELLFVHHGVPDHLNLKQLFVKQLHSVKSIHSLRYSGLHFPIFGLNMERYSILRISPYSVWMQENADQNNSDYKHFLRSVVSWCLTRCEKSTSYLDSFLILSCLIILHNFENTWACLITPIRNYWVTLLLLRKMPNCMEHSNFICIRKILI